MNDNFYRAFEDRYRGSRELIKSRLRAYLPFVEPLCEQYPASPALDLGCGRGEWLEVMATAGLCPTGIDLDEGMLSACHDLGLTVIKGEAVAYLSALAENSQAVVSAFHVVEHINFDDVRRLVFEAQRVLKPGGLLIMETPNPENIIVATRMFFLDPSHKRPIPSELLSFVPEYYDFKRVKVIRLQEPSYLNDREVSSLIEVFHGVSPDYAVVAQKKGDQAMMASTAKAFEQEYGLTLETLSERYDSAKQLAIQQAESKAEQAGAQARQAESKAEQAGAQARQAESKAEQAGAQAQQAENKAQDARVLAQQTVSHCVQQGKVRMERHMELLEAQSVALEQRAIAAEQSVFYWQQQANQWQEQIVFLHDSTSWKITKPLRAIKRIMIGDGIVKLRAKRVLGPVVSSCVGYVFKHPELRNKLSPCLKCFPWLHQRLLKFGVNSGAVQLAGKSVPASVLASQSTPGLDLRVPLEQGYRLSGNAPDIEAILDKIRSEIEKGSVK